MDYDERQASAYGGLSLEGSTFEISLLPAIRAMGDLRGKLVLDFGAGTGRTARALRVHGARFVVAVDINQNMLRAASKYPGVGYVQVGRTLPLADGTLDTALCANVLSEFSSLDAMKTACREIWRVLKPASSFVIVVPNPESVDCDYVSYAYIDAVSPERGSQITCLLKGPEPSFVKDYYWLTDDYVGVLESVGFELNEVLAPKADHGGGWLDETRMAPDLVMRATRSAPKHVDYSAPSAAAEPRSGGSESDNGTVRHR